MPVLKSAANPSGSFSATKTGRQIPARADLHALASEAARAAGITGYASLPPWSLAAPSCVLPADVGTNCTALARHFPELGLCFFETGACLGYTEADLPADLRTLPVRWHMHLPLDLPWTGGADAVAKAILALAEKVAGLAPWAYVLHPPEAPDDLRGGGAEQLRCVALALKERGISPEALLVENIRGRDLETMWPVVRELGLGVCLDLGHMLERGQEDFLTLPGLWVHARMLHLNAPDEARPGRHAALDRLDAAGQAVLGRMLSSFAPGGSVVLELFSPRELFDSLRFVQTFWADLNGNNADGRKEDTA
ncbi:MAG: sugar phosphate isomerase/epimerase [Proteobacteria bacterium]|nr:sugar phosphate isomerase/epimerase [Pseudomonadota bacterium]